MIVAIDGPAGAGKSTVARRLAERLGFRYLDTGAMYRAVTWLAIEQSLDLEDGAALGRLAEENPVDLDEEGRVTIAGSDVTAEIRQPEIDRVVPTVARHPEVRQVMRRRQRDLADLGNAVIEGRDIGTVVAPDATVKIYLVAERGERAVEIVLHRQHVARKGGRGVGGGVLLLLLEPATDVLGLGLGVEDVLAHLLQLLFELRQAVLVGILRVEIDRVADRVLDLLGIVFNLLFVDHANNLDSACAVKSTMGTTRA